jgi:hypothetical protein
VLKRTGGKGGWGRSSWLVADDNTRPTIKFPRAGDGCEQGGATHNPERAREVSVTSPARVAGAKVPALRRSVVRCQHLPVRPAGALDPFSAAAVGEEKAPTLSSPGLMASGWKGGREGIADPSSWCGRTTPEPRLGSDAPKNRGCTREAAVVVDRRDTGVIPGTTRGTGGREPIKGGRAGIVREDYRLRVPG